MKICSGTARRLLRPDDGLSLVAVLLLASLTMSTASAASITKADNTTALNDSASWVGGSVPASGDVAIWDSTVTSANTVALGADLDWQGIQVLDPAGSVTITAGNTLSLGSGGIDLLAATADLAVEAGIALTANQSWRAAAGRTITLAGDITGSADVTIGGSVITTNTFLTTTAQPLFPNATLSTLASASGVMEGGFVNGSIPGLGYLLTNDGTTANYWLEVIDSPFTKGLQIELAQSGTDVTARAVQAKYVSGSQLGFDFNTGGTQGTVATSPTAGGYGAASTTLSFASGSGTTRITGNPTYTGATNLVAGTLDIASATDVTLSGVISGGGDLVKSGTGTLTLSAANTHSGATRLEAGILAAGNNAALGTGALTLAGGTIRPTANRVIGNAISVATGTTSGLIDGGSGDLMYTGAATGDGNLAANSTTSRSMWLQGDWSGFTGEIEFTVNTNGTNYRLGGAPGSTSANDGTNGSDFSQATFVLSGGGTNRGLSWNGVQGATVQVGTLSGTGGRIITGASGRDANWEIGGLNADSSTAVVITGPGTSLTKVGTGTLTLNGSSSYGNGTTVNAGTLNLDATSAIGNGSLTIAAGASVNALRAFAISTDGAAAGRVVNVAGSLSMVDSEYVETYNLTGGLIAAPTSGGGYLRAPTAGFSINSLAAATNSQITGRIDLTYSSGTVDVADGAAADDLVISASILQNTGAGSGAKSITKTGAGTLLLSGTSSYAGGTFINAGLVKAGSSRALGAENTDPSTVTIADGATLDINRVTGNTGDFYYGMTIAGSGTEGQGALINTGADGSTTLRQTPNITLSADAAIGGSGNILMINGGYAANDLDLADNTLTKTGSNTLFLCNTTVSAGTIDIQEGTLSHFTNAANASAAAITLADAAGATLALNNLGLQVGSLAGGGATGGNVTLGSGTLTLGGRNEDASFAGVISGTGAVVKTGTGTQTFAAANTYSGGTTISGGTLLAGVADAFGTTGTLTVEAGGTLGVGAGVDFTRAFTLNTGGKVWLGDNATIALPDAAALAAWESGNTAGGDGTVADILYGSGGTTPSALTSAWTANPGSYFSDILTLEGTGTGNTYVLSMTYNPAASGSLNIWYRENPSDPFAPLGTSFQGDTAWNSGFTTVGQYGIDSATGTVWAVTDHNSQFAVVPEPGTLGLAGLMLVGGMWYARRRHQQRK